MLDNYSFFIEIISSFFFGVLTSFTPCVYPMIPITIAIFSGHEHDKKTVIIRSLLYTLGMVVTYSLLGYLAAKSSFVFGGLLGNSIIAVSLAMVVYSLGLVNLDFITFEFARLRNTASKLGGASSFGAFIMGVVSGIVGAPCVGPNALAILALIAKEESTIRGVVALASYALGLSSVILIFVIFGKNLFKFIKPGAWLNNIKTIIAILVFMVALHIIVSSGVISLKIPTSYLIALTFVALGLIFIKHKFSKLIATNILAICIYAFLFPPIISTWNTSYSDALKLAKENNKPVFIDLKAKWCAACHELEEKTFPDKEVQKFLTKYNLLSLDFTENTDENDKFFEKFNVQGLPTMLVIDENEKELKRIEGFVTPEELISKLQ